jgi:hypothetical protein
MGVDILTLKLSTDISDKWDLFLCIRRNRIEISREQRGFCRACIFRLQCNNCDAKNNQQRKHCMPSILSFCLYSSNTSPNVGGLQIPVLQLVHFKVYSANKACWGYKYGCRFSRGPSMSLPNINSPLTLGASLSRNRSSLVYEQRHLCLESTTNGSRQRLTG